MHWRKLKRLQETAAKMGDFFAKIPDEEIIESIKIPYSWIIIYSLKIPADSSWMNRPLI